MEACQKVKWFSTAVNTPRDAVEDPHFRGHGFWQEAEHPVTGKQVYPGAPIKLGDSWRINRAAPLLGEHNREVYGDQLGCSEEDLERLKAENII
jgi:crotonobetainyl-CoA:carnitine CoA-transferase CaiB-like acyl-CoA transferase